MFHKLIKLILSRRTLVIALLVLQVSAIVSMLWQSSAKFKAAAVLLNILSVIAVFYILNRKDKPGYKVTWIALILVIPLFGGILYLMFRIQSSVSRLRNRFAKYEKQARSLLLQDQTLIEKLRADSPDAAICADYLYNNGGFPVYANTCAEYFPSGEYAFESMVQRLKEAKKFIFLEYFIIDSGIVWNTILGILTEKVKEGVEVRVIYDDMGCIFSLPPKYYRTLRELGIKCVAFNPFRPFWTTLQNNRTHRKIMVIDGEIAYTGGMNLADEYINAAKRFGHWKDSVIMLSGEAVWSFTVMYLNMWDSINGEEEDFTRFRSAAVSYCPDAADPGNNSLVQPYSDNPIDNEYVGEHVYMQIINNARKYMYITTPYLIIDDSMITAIKLAAKSGVDIRIITPHIPDKWLVHLTTRSYYEELICAGVRIYEYKPGFIHAKNYISDDKSAILGTANLDFRSLYLHFECGVRLYHARAIADMKADYLKTLAECMEITMEMCRNRNVFVKLLQDVIRFLAPLL